MLVYRSQAASRAPRPWLEQLSWNLRTSDASLEACRERCVDFGELEAALADWACPEQDACTPLTRALRRAGACLAEAFVAAFEGETARAAWSSARAQQSFDDLLQRDLPEQVAAKTPEGFAYYGLYPEQYVEAAKAALRACRPERAVVLGLRSIGSTLASVVEATLARGACRVSSYLLRPRGEPFERSSRLAPELQAELRAKTDALFLVVDEGPGLSGSSLTCVARALRDLGIARERIVLLPSHRADATRFVNARAREIWSEHRCFVAPFEPAWLQRVAEGAELQDLSGGRWRATFGAEGRAIVAHPQHERRKYRARRANGESFMLRFVGLGAHGRRVRERAQALEACGLTPKVVGFGDGMLALEDIPGRILSAPPAGMALVVASYLAARRHRLRAVPAELEPLREMAHYNISEALAPEACRALPALVARARSRRTNALVTDGRMLLHEWLVTANGLRKLDAFEHGDDHFYPGPCDIAWDIAGACVELRLSRAERHVLLTRYVSASDDAAVHDRLPFFEVAYLAYRLGYARLATQALAGTDAEMDFARLERGYHERLRARLAERAP